MDQKQVSWSIEERTFCTGNVEISVLPNFSFGTISLLCGDYGPFSPSKFSKIPLWVAVHLRKSLYCRIITPEWMEKSALQRCLVEEEEYKESFYSLPFFWHEISTLLLSVAKEDIENVQEIRLLLQKIKEVRARKVDEGLKEIDSRPLSLKNIGCMELNRVKPFLLSVANQLTQFSLALQNAQKIKF